MQIAVVTNEALKAELLAQGIQEALQITWLHEPAQVAGVTNYIDLLFDETPERINTWKKLNAQLVIVNAVYSTTEEWPATFVRINGWPTLLQRPVVEAAANNEAVRVNTQNVFFYFNRQVEWVADVPGFISARVISMIINEAYHALAEKVSSKEEIDVAMKLGTNYPYGPFEWGEKAGLYNIYKLLNLLAESDIRYQPAHLLLTEATR